MQFLSQPRLTSTNHRNALHHLIVSIKKKKSLNHRESDQLSTLNSQPSSTFGHAIETQFEKGRRKKSMCARARYDEIQFRSNENRQDESHWLVPAGPLGAVGSLCTRAGAIAGYANGGGLPKEVITLPTFAQPPTSHRNFNSCRSYMLIQNQNRFPTASSAAQIYTRSRKDNRGYYGGGLTPFSLSFARRNVNQLCDVNRFGWRDCFLSFFFFFSSRFEDDEVW